MKTIVLSDHTGDMGTMWEIRYSQLHDIEMARYWRESEDLDSPSSPIKYDTGPDSRHSPSCDWFSERFL